MKTLLDFDYRKATQVINYLTQREGGSIDKLKLLKLIYLADRFHLRRYGRPIINDTYFAMRLGPVASFAKDIAEFSAFQNQNESEYSHAFIGKGNSENLVISVKDTEMSVFSDSEIEALDRIYNEFGNKSASKLVDITHEYPEWLKFKEQLESKAVSRQPMSYFDFFLDSTNSTRDFFAMNAEVLSASKDLFEEDYKVAEFWK